MGSSDGSMTSVFVLVSENSGWHVSNIVADSILGPQVTTSAAMPEFAERSYKAGSDGKPFWGIVVVTPEGPPTAEGNRRLQEVSDTLERMAGNLSPNRVLVVDAYGKLTPYLSKFENVIKAGEVIRLKSELRACRVLTQDERNTLVNILQRTDSFMEVKVFNPVAAKQESKLPGGSIPGPEDLRGHHRTGRTEVLGARHERFRQQNGMIL